MKNMSAKISAIVIVVVLLAGALMSSVTVVEAGHSGVVLTFGAVSDTPLSEGMHFKIPFVQNVIPMNIRTQKTETTGAASSRDLQVIAYEVALNYHINGSTAATLYKTVGEDYEDIVINPAIQESIKAVCAGYTAEELITERQAVSEGIKANLSEKISSYGITVDIFNIINFDFSDEFDAAVEAKQTAQQNALKAEQDLARIEVEARQKITQAEAEAESIRLIQQALADAPDYVEYVKWSKWNGVLPTVMGSNDLILDIGSPKTNTQTSVPAPATANE